MSRRFLALVRIELGAACLGCAGPSFHTYCPLDQPDGVLLVVGYCKSARCARIATEAAERYLDLGRAIGRAFFMPSIEANYVKRATCERPTQRDRRANAANPRRTYAARLFTTRSRLHGGRAS